MKEGGVRLNKRRKAAKLLKNSVIIVAVLGCIVFIPLVLFNIAVSISVFAHPNDLPSAFGLSTLAEATDDMNGESGLKNGDLAIINRNKQPEIGDIAAIKHNGVLMLRRVTAKTVGKEGNAIYTMIADKNPQSEITVNATDVYGKYDVRIAGLGNLLIFSQSTAGVIIFIGGSALLFVLYDVLEKTYRSRFKRGETLQSNLGAAE